MRVRTDKKQELILQLLALKVPPFVCEYRFHPTRQWRFDLSWIDEMFAVEVDGGLYVNGGHSRGAAREADMEKDAEAMCLGWTVMRVSPRLVKDGSAAKWIEQILKPVSS